MKTRKQFLFSVLALAVLLNGTGCTQYEQPGAGELTVSFSTGMPETRATAPGDGDAADGGGIILSGSGTQQDPYHDPDLVILIADPNGDIVSCYPSPSPASAVLQDDPTPERMSVTFKGLDAGGLYTVYAFANTQGLWDMTCGGVPVSNLTSLTTAAQVEALQFAPLAAGTAPVVRNDRLPLSARGTVEVSSQGNGTVSLELLRCVSKVTLEFVNNTGFSLELDDLNFRIGNMCPDRGYVTPHDLPEVPAGTTYDALTSGADLTDQLFAAHGATKSYVFYVFPGVSPEGRYLLNVDFTATVGTSPTPTVSTGHFANLPVHDDHARNIVSLERNQHLHIVTRISKGLTVSCNFEVAGWGTPLDEIVSFE